MAMALQRSLVEDMVRQALRARLAAPPAAAGPGPAASPLVVNVSARHCHLTEETVEILFGKGHRLEPFKWLYQEGQYAARETLTLIGPRSRVISNLRVLGPCRSINQVELSYTDAIALGFDIPLRCSGDIEGTPGCMLMGPAGFFKLEQGVIRALRHVHMNPEEAARYGVEDRQDMRLRVGGDCGLVLERMLVRVDPASKLEVHIDTDEGNACRLEESSVCELLA